MSRYSKSKAVTPSDTADITPGTTYDAFYVGGAGNIAAVLEDGSVVQIAGAAVKEIWPLAIRRVNATNTTATNLVALKF